MLRSIWIFVTLFGLSSKVFAETSLEFGWNLPAVSTSKFTDWPAVNVKNDQTDDVWYKSIPLNDKPSIRLQLTFTSLPVNNNEWKIVILGKKGSSYLKLEEIDATKLKGAELPISYWTKRIVGKSVYEEVAVKYVKRSDHAGLSFSLSKYLVGKTVSQPKSIFGRNNLEPLSAIMDAKILQRGKNVAKITFVRNDAESFCSGFLIAPDLLMTNHHCVMTPSHCQSAEIIFNYLEEDKPDYVTAKKCASIESLDKDLDYSVLRLDSKNDNAFLPLSIDNLINTKDDLFVIQHPNGDPLQVARHECQVKELNVFGISSLVKTDFTHICDTRGGSSGSPVYSSSGELIGLHHYGFEKGQTRKLRNHAVYIEPILDHIKLTTLSVYNEIKLTRPNSLALGGGLQLQ